jgi:aminopeptidase N
MPARWRCASSTRPHDMTEREGALRALADSEAARSGRRRWPRFASGTGDRPALLDKWFAVQAGSARDDTIDTAPRLLAHPDFTLAHPGRLAAVVGTFAANMHAFHDCSGRGYRFVADVALVADRADPATAARMVRALAPMPRLEAGRAALMATERERIAAPASPPSSANACRRCA